MEAIAFPDLERHKKLHFEYIEKTSDLNLSFILKKPDISNEIMEFLVFWWKNHILIEDMKIKEFLISKKGS
jgi:hemerythrin-like metal-binding protein